MILVSSLFLSHYCSGLKKILWVIWTNGKHRTGFTDAQKNMMLLLKETHEGLRITGIITVT